jgi:hypothetical protein
MMLLPEIERLDNIHGNVYDKNVIQQDGESVNGRYEQVLSLREEWRA